MSHPIASATSPAMLRIDRMEEQEKLYKLYKETPIQRWNRSVADLHDAVMRRAVALCEESMVQEGFGPPPVPYAFIVFGSAGREEQTLWSDQDNGLVIGDGEEEEQVRDYFQAFGDKLVQILTEAGYPPCPGNVMVSNPLWRKSLKDWEKQLWYWSGLRGWEQVRYLMIAADMRYIAGSQELAAKLSMAFAKVIDQGDEYGEDLSAAILRNTLRHKAALNVLGQLITEPVGDYAGDFDLKYGLYIPLVNAIRYLSLQYGIHASSTWERILQLHQLEAVPIRWLESCREAFDTAIKLRSISPIRHEDGSLDGNNYLPQSVIKQKEVRSELRNALGTVRLMYRTLQRQHRYAERKWL